jgi:hypothetical protein
VPHTQGRGTQQSVTRQGRRVVWCAVCVVRAHAHRPLLLLVLAGHSMRLLSQGSAHNHVAGGVCCSARRHCYCCTRFVVAACQRQTPAAARATHPSPGC